MGGVLRAARRARAPRPADMRPRKRAAIRAALRRLQKEKPGLFGWLGSPMESRSSGTGRPHGSNRAHKHRKKHRKKHSAGSDRAQRGTPRMTSPAATVTPPIPAVAASSEPPTLEYAALLLDKSADPENVGAAEALSEEEIERAVEIFAKFDRDQDGVLDAREFAPLVQSVLLAGRQRADAWPLHLRALFHKHDANHDQRVDFLEFLNAQLDGSNTGPKSGQPRAARSAAARALEAVLQEFADEGLSAQELGEAADAFRRAETRNDGTLSARAYRSVLTRLAPEAALNTDLDGAVESTFSPASSQASTPAQSMRLAAVDLDGDRRVDFLELVRALAKRKQEQQERQKQLQQRQLQRRLQQQMQQRKQRDATQKQPPQQVEEEAAFVPLPPRSAAPTQPGSDAFLAMLAAAEARDESHRATVTAARKAAQPAVSARARTQDVGRALKEPCTSDVLYRESLREGLEVKDVDIDGAEAELALALFLKFDTKREGRLEIDAWHGIMAAHDKFAAQADGARILSIAERRAIFGAIDSSGDNSVSLSELIAFLACPPEDRPTRALLNIAALAKTCDHDAEAAAEGIDKAARRRQRRSREAASAPCSPSGSPPSSSTRRGRRSRDSHGSRGTSPAASGRTVEGSHRRSGRRGGSSSSSLRRSTGGSNEVLTSTTEGGVFTQVMNLAANRGAAMVAHAINAAPVQVSTGSLNNLVGNGLEQVRASASAAGSRASEGLLGDYLTMPSVPSTSDLRGMFSSESIAELQAHAGANAPIWGLRAAVGGMNLLGSRGAGSGAS